MKPLAASLLLLSGLAQATDVGVSELPCPFGEGNVRVYSKLSTNRLGGWDSDLASYAVGGQWRTYAISTCPSSLYSFPSEAGPDPKLQEVTHRERLMTLLEQARAEFGENPSPWDRYEIAIRILSLDRSPEPLRLARLYLSAAWTARDVAVDVYKGLEGPEMAWKLLQTGEAELQKPQMDASTKKILLHNLARVAHRGGYLAERDMHLASFEGLGPLSAEEQKVLSDFQMVKEVEPRLLTQAASHLDAHIAQAVDSRSKSWALYVRGDIARRAGETEKAKTHFNAVLASEQSEPQIRHLATWLLEGL
jgi:hypothetical protein